MTVTNLLRLNILPIFFVIVSDNRGVGPCILAMRMAFKGITELPKNFKFIADGYSAYPLAAQQFFRQFGDKFKFEFFAVGD